MELILHSRQQVTAAFHRVTDGRTSSSIRPRLCREAMMISPVRRRRCAVSRSIGAPVIGDQRSRDRTSRGRLAIGVQTPWGKSMKYISSLMPHMLSRGPYQNSCAGGLWRELVRRATGNEFKREF